MNALANRAMNQYKQVGTHVGADIADSHQLIVMLFDGALERISIAKGAVVRKDIEEKGQKIGRVIAIVDGLRASLDKERGGAIAENLDNLYDYIQRKLFEANLNNDLDILNEVADLLIEVRSAWVAIASEVRQTTNE